jgi:hypothetical protein
MNLYLDQLQNKQSNGVTTGEPNKAKKDNASSVDQ